MRVNFGTGMGRNLRVDEVAEHSRVAEKAGFSHLTFIDSQNLSRDVYSMMTIAAVNTRQIRIGHGVTNPFTRHPSVTANATGTIDELSGGRAFIGLGVGMSAVGTMETRRSSMEEMRDAVTFYKDYTSGKEAAYRGTRMRSEWIGSPLPVYVGCEGPRSLQLTGALADGAISTGVHPSIAEWKLEQLQKGAEKAGRDPGQVDLWVRTMCYVAESKEKARREVQSYAATSATAFYFSILRWNNPDVEQLKDRLEPEVMEDIKKAHDAYDYYEHERTDAPHGKVVTQRVLDHLMLTGTPDDICEQIEKLFNVGVRTVSMTVYTIIDKKGMLEEIGDKIISRFR